MGHANLSNISEMVTKYLYTGSKSLREMVDYAMKHGIELRASEGAYTDEGMISYGIEIVLMAYFDPSTYFYPSSKLAKPVKIIEPKDITDEQTVLLHDYCNGNIEYDDEKFETLMNIKWGYTKEGRKIYLAKELPMVTSHTN